MSAVAAKSIALQRAACGTGVPDKQGPRQNWAPTSPGFWHFYSSRGRALATKRPIDQCPVPCRGRRAPFLDSGPRLPSDAPLFQAPWPLTGAPWRHRGGPPAYWWLTVRGWCLGPCCHGRKAWGFDDGGDRGRGERGSARSNLDPDLDGPALSAAHGP